MKFLSALPLITLSTEIVGSHDGSLFFISPEISPAPIRLGLDGRNIVLGDTLAFFAYHNTDNIIIAHGDMFLTINCHGKLVLAEFPIEGFRLTQYADSVWRKRLSFKGEYEFQLCGDGLIGFQSTCGGARWIQISYEQDWPFPM